MTRMIVPASIVACLACITYNSDNQSGNNEQVKSAMSIKLSQKCNSSGKKKDPTVKQAQDTGAPYGMSKQSTTQFLEREVSQFVKYCFPLGKILIKKTAWCRFQIVTIQIAEKAVWI